MTDLLGCNPTVSQRRSVLTYRLQTKGKVLEKYRLETWIMHFRIHYFTFFFNFWTCIAFIRRRLFWNQYVTSTLIGTGVTMINNTFQRQLKKQLQYIVIWGIHSPVHSWAVTVWESEDHGSNQGEGIPLPPVSHTPWPLIKPKTWWSHSCFIVFVCLFLLLFSH